MSLKKREQINVIRYGGGGHPALIEYSSLPAKYRVQWESMHGEPGKTKAFKPFAERLTKDWAVRNELTQYRYNGTSTLDVVTQESYARDAEIFNAITETFTEMRAARGQARKSMQKSWDLMLSLVDEIREVYTPNNIPTTAITLKRKYDRYISEGYLSLIHKNFGNRNAGRVPEGLCEDTLLELLSHGNQLPASMVAEHYNMWAAPSGHDTITERTVLNYLAKHEFEISAQRKGLKVWADKYDPIIQRYRPSAPLQLINSDDNDLDLYFNRIYVDKNGKKHTDHYYRPKLYVVLDAHCDYILGYAWGDQITTEVIKEAFRNALNHIKEITGNYYLWHQTVADRWGITSEGLQTFYNSFSNYTPPTAKLARAKIIESSFGTPWHNTLKSYNNYAGHNITAVEKHNSDFAQSHLSQRPNIAEAPYQIAQFIERMRDLPWLKSKQSRREVWLENFNSMAAARERYISTEQYLQIFGRQHEYTNTLTNGGLTVTIGEIKRNYDIPDNIYRVAVGKKVRVTYDPANLSRVLVEGDKVRFVASENTPMPMAL
ncbi:MAG: hypothetical protein RSC11_07105, partial [Mucinivorans sp.]